MTDTPYFINIDGKITEIPSIDKICKILKRKFETTLTQNEVLRKQVDQLTDENWKDKELQKMKQQLEEACDHAYRGFPITKEENVKISNWIKEHEASAHNNSETFPRGGAIGGSYQYIFTPTGIGIFGTVKCSCGEKFDFRSGEDF